MNANRNPTKARVRKKGEQSHGQILNTNNSGIVWMAENRITLIGLGHTSLRTV